MSTPSKPIRSSAGGEVSRELQSGIHKKSDIHPKIPKGSKVSKVSRVSKSSKVSKDPANIPAVPPGSNYLEKDPTKTKTWEGEPTARIGKSETGIKLGMEPVRRGLLSAFIAFMVVSFVYFIALSDAAQGLLFTFFALLAVSAYFAISVPTGDAWGSKTSTATASPGDGR